VVPLDDQAVQDIESELARHIGPLARVLVRKARPLANSMEQLREALAPLYPGAEGARPVPRRRGPQPSAEQHPSSSHPSSYPPSQSTPLSQPRSTSKPRSAAPSGPPPAPGRTVPAGGWSNSANSIPVTTRPGTTQRAGVTQPASGLTRTSPTSARALDIPPDELHAIELALSKHIGPMAKMLIKRELNASPDLKTFVTAISANIDKADQREAFMETLRRTLHKRSF
jgi:hypothetical protein